MSCRVAYTLQLCAIECSTARNGDGDELVKWCGMPCGERDAMRCGDESDVLCYAVLCCDAMHTVQWGVLLLLW